MHKLILIKHSLPEMISALPARSWLLSETGRRRCKPLADMLAIHQPDVIITSVEPKALETGQIVASLLDKPCETAPGLHEHDRSNESFGTQEQFQASVAEFFARPGKLVFGLETADQAHHRFSQALTGVLEQHPAQNVALVAHGTVITLFVARSVGLRFSPALVGEPFAFWQRLGLPSFVLLARPGFDILDVAETVERK
jgi:broad specificity phosphatase PhoE